MLNFKEYWNNRPADIYKPRIYIKDVVDFLKPKSVIEIGCGNGRWAEFFENYKGYDFAEKRIKDKSNLFYGDILDGINDKADLVFCNMILLHIKNAKKAIENMLKISNRLLLIEPITYRLQYRAEHCFYHNYLNLITDSFIWRVIPQKEEDSGIIVKL